MKKRISILFNIESHFPVNRVKVKSALENALIELVNGDTELSVSVIGDRRMRMLNRTYRNFDATTDVLSFPLYDEKKMEFPFITAPDRILRLGDIVISYPEAVREAGEANKFVDDIVIELALHGLNHLLGIHHPE